MEIQYHSVIQNGLRFSWTASGGDKTKTRLYRGNKCNEISEIYLCIKDPEQSKNKHLIKRPIL